MKRAAAVGCLAALLTAGCLLSVSHVEEDQLPAEWRSAFANLSSDPSALTGRFSNEGTGVFNEGKESAVRLTDVFFPGAFPRRSGGSVDAVALDWTPEGKLRARALSGPTTRAEVVLVASRDAATAWTDVQGIPVKDTNKFGATMNTQRARVALASSGQLYVEVHATAVGIVLFLPAAGARTVWGRWSPLP